MKKIFLMLAVVAGCTVFTSCKSDAEKAVVEKTDAEKAAQLAYDAEKAMEEGNLEEIEKLQAEFNKLVEANADNADFMKEAEEAYNKLKEADNK